MCGSMAPYAWRRAEPSDGGRARQAAPALHWERALSQYSQILFEVADGVATITLHRPDKMNAFTGTMMQEMCDALDRTDADDAVRLAPEIIGAQSVHRRPFHARGIRPGLGLP